MYNAFFTLNTIFTSAVEKIFIGAAAIISIDIINGLQPIVEINKDWFSILFLCLIIDYTTGILASIMRKEKFDKEKILFSAVRKLCYGFLILIGIILDYTFTKLGITDASIFSKSSALFLMGGELKSALSNLSTIGVPIVSFLASGAEALKKIGKGNGGNK